MMRTLKLVLGLEPFGEAERSALPALLGLCRALGIRTHWDQTEDTLYVEPPVWNRHVGVLGSEGLAELIAHDLRLRLSRSGATIAEPGNLAGAEAVIAVEPSPNPGVTVLHSWRPWHLSRKLAALAGDAVAESAGLENRGARVAFGRQVAGGAPLITVQIGHPDVHPAPILMEGVAEGLYNALARFWLGSCAESSAWSFQEARLCGAPDCEESDAEDEEPAAEPGPVSHTYVPEWDCSAIPNKVEVVSEVNQQPDHEVQPLPEATALSEPDPLVEPDPEFEADLLPEIEVISEVEVEPQVEVLPDIEVVEPEVVFASASGPSISLAPVPVPALGPQTPPDHSQAPTQELECARLLSVTSPQPQPQALETMPQPNPKMAPVPARWASASIRAQANMLPPTHSGKNSHISVTVSTRKFAHAAPIPPGTPIIPWP